MEQVLKPIRAHLHANVAAPSAARWDVERTQKELLISAEIEAARLAVSFQEDACATPSFLVAFAFWIESITGVRCVGRLKVIGEPPNADRLKWQRSLFILDEFQRLLSGRLEVLATECWKWPERPILNVSGERRADVLVSAKPGSELALERSICSSDGARRQFEIGVEPIVRFERQLPVGLFRDRVLAANRVLPGGKSQVDLWARSADGETVHLFELKAPGNVGLGILPEAFCYTRLLQSLRKRPVAVEGNGPALHAIGKAKRLRMWLAAPTIHPLVHRHGASPLAWLNAAMAAEDVQMGILPLRASEAGFEGWELGSRWPP